MTLEGVIHDVRVETAGSFCTAALATDTVLFVDDAVDFNEDGGQLSINGTVYNYVSADLDTDSITLSAAIGAVLDNAFIQVEPLQVVKNAVVVLTDSEDSITALVPHALYDTIPDGIRSEGERESVALDYQNGTLMISDVLGKVPAIDGGYIAEGTIGLLQLDPDVDFGGGITTYAQADAPTSPSEGDIWVDTDNDNLLQRYDGTTWIALNDPNIQQAITDALNAANLADSKMSIYYADNAPTTDPLGNTLGASNAGDLWFDTNDQNHPYRWSGSAWLDVRDGGIQNAIDIATTASSTAQEASDAALPDGIAPFQSPDAVVDGGIGSLFVHWSPIANHDPVTYEVHISTTAGFTPSTTTLYVKTPGASTTIRNLPSGSALQYGTTYYVKIVATDVDGKAPVGQEANGTTVQAGQSDISSDYAYIGEIKANQIQGGTINADITVAAKIKTADAGARAEIDNSGVILYDSTGSPETVLASTGDSTFKGHVEADGLTILGGMSLRSNNNEIAQTGQLRLADRINASKQAPSVVMDWAQTQLLDSTGNAFTGTTISGLTQSPDGDWLVGDGYAIRKWNANGTYDSTIGAGWSLTGAVQTVTGGDYYGLTNNGAASYVARLSESTISSPTDYTANAALGTTDETTTPLSTSFRTKSVQSRVDINTSMPSGQTVYLKVQKDANNWVKMEYKGGVLSMNHAAAGITSSGSVAYTPSMLYWKIVESAGSFQFYTSADGNSWTSQRAVIHAITDANLTGMTLYRGTNNPSTVNMINGTFESSISGWSANSGTLARSTAQYHSGTASMLLTAGGGINTVISTSVSVSANHAYNISAWNLADQAGRSTELRVLWRNASGATISTVTVPITAGTTWTSGTTGNIVAPANTTSAVVQLAGSGNTLLYWDDVVFVEAPTPTNVSLIGHTSDSWVAGTVGSSTSSKGTYSLDPNAMTVTTTSPVGQAFGVWQDIGYVEAGATYRLTGTARVAGIFGTTNASTFSLEIIWKDSSGATVSTSITTLAASESNQTLTLNAVVPTGANNATVRVGNVGGGTSAWQPDIDFYKTVNGTATISTLFSVGTFKSAKVVSSFSRTNTSQTPVMGRDGSNIIVAEYNTTTNAVVVKTFSTDTLAVTSTVTSGAFAAGQIPGALHGILRGTFDFGVDCYVVASDSYAYAFNTAGTLQPNFNFNMSSSGVLGLGWDGSNFYSLSAGFLSKYESGTKWTTESSQWKAGFTWSDGTNQTTLSAVNSFVMKKRARVRVTSPTFPTGSIVPNRIKVYMTRGTDTNYYYQATSATGSTTVLLSTATFSGTTAPATNNWPAGEPGGMFSDALDTSSSPYIKLAGDGTWRLGPLSGTGTTVTNPPWTPKTGVGQTARILKPTSQSIANASETLLTWSGYQPAPYFPYNTWFTYSSGVLTLNPGFDGFYTFNAFLYWAGGTSGTNTAGTRRILVIYKNGAAVMRNDGVAKATSLAASGVQCVVDLPMVAGDTIYINGYQDSGAALGQTALEGQMGFWDITRNS